MSVWRWIHPLQTEFTCATSTPIGVSNLTKCFFVFVCADSVQQDDSEVPWKLTFPILRLAWGNPVVQTWSHTQWYVLHSMAGDDFLVRMYVWVCGVSVVGRLVLLLQQCYKKAMRGLEERDGGGGGGGGCLDFFLNIDEEDWIWEKHGQVSLLHYSIWYPKWLLLWTVHALGLIDLVYVLWPLWKPVCLPHWHFVLSFCPETTSLRNFWATTAIGQQPWSSALCCGKSETQRCVPGLVCFLCLSFQVPGWECCCCCSVVIFYVFSTKPVLFYFLFICWLLGQLAFYLCCRGYSKASQSDIRIRHGSRAQTLAPILVTIGGSNLGIWDPTQGGWVSDLSQCEQLFRMHAHAKRVHGFCNKKMLSGPVGCSFSPLPEMCWFECLSHGMNVSDLFFFFFWYKFVISYAYALLLLVPTPPSSVKCSISGHS